MSRVLFVITTSKNMGDLALCQEWIAGMGEQNNVFGFVMHRGMLEYVSKESRTFLYDPEEDVKETILSACATFHPDAIIFATNSFWNLPDCKGSTFGEFILRPGDVEVPVLSFDPIELGFPCELPHGAGKVVFPTIPDWVWALRYMSRFPKTPNALHYCPKAAFEVTRNIDKERLVKMWGGRVDRKSVFFPVSKDRYSYVAYNYPGYYQHLANIFGEFSDDEVQFYIVTPEKIPEFVALPHVIQLPLIKYWDFVDLVAAADVYLADSFISCIFNAFLLGTPTVLINNTESSRHLEAGSFLQDKFFPYKVFPYGLTEVCNELESLWEVKDCYTTLEVLDVQMVVAGIRDVLFTADHEHPTKKACADWMTARFSLPSPKEIMQEVLAKKKPMPQGLRNGE